MDAYEATCIVFSRIQALDPDNAAKIIGLLLIQNHGEKEMIRLAFGPEAFLRSVILKARKDLGLLSPTSPLSLLTRQNSSRSGPASPSSWAPHLPFSRSNITDDVVDDEFLLQEQQISFLNEQEADPGGYWDQDGFGRKPCLYFARGFCQNGSSCRFVHGPADDMSAAAAAAAAVEQQCQEIMLMRSKSQRLAASAAVAAAFPYSPTGSSSCKNLNFMLQQQQNESQRVAMAAAAALMLENENHKFIGRPRMERDFTGMVIPGSRQIYLTFPADSTFREEDVSNYFSIYGPVEDVRIPYQQKRMFGFVTFVYPETVKIVLAKGNPHFVCDARVLVKPYKEKGKLPDKKRQHAERFDFSGCTTPTGFDSRDPFDIQQLMSPRMMYGGSNHDLLVRKKMEEQLAAAEMQQAIEMQGRRFIGLQLLDIKNRSLASPTVPILSPLATPNSTAFDNNAIFSDAGSSNNGSHDEDKSLSPAATGTAALSAAAAYKQQTAVDSGESEPTPNEDMCFQQQSAEHNLPDSPFSSPTKSSIVSDSFFVANEESSFVSSNGSSNGHHNASSLLPASSPLESMNPSKSYFLQIPRFSSGHGAVGL